MKFLDFYGLKICEISSHAKDDIIKKVHEVQTRNGPAGIIHILGDGRVLYELAEDKIYLFNSLDELSIFDLKSREITYDLVQPKVNVSTGDFIDNIDYYVNLSRREYKLLIDSDNSTFLNRLDSILNALPVEEILEKSPVFCAAIGEFVKLQIANSEWMWLNGPEKNREPIVFYGESFFSPCRTLNLYLTQRMEGKIGASIATEIYSIVKYYIDKDR